ncbi:MAG: helix-turn-helix transcriptional regulator [Paludibacteraceae bacterium]|nr:helix-turn-helix transcriptional regulator [Paludibacteraceae bacterium]
MNHTTIQPQTGNALFYPSATRKQLAAAAGVSRQTFSRWIKHSSDFDMLSSSGEIRRHVFSPKTVRYLCEKYDIDPRRL